MLQDVCGVPDVDGGKLLRAFPAVLDVGVHAPKQYIHFGLKVVPT